MASPTEGLKDLTKETPATKHIVAPAAPSMGFDARDKLLYIMPSGIPAVAYEMTTLDVNQLLSDDLQQEAFYRLLKAGIKINPDDENAEYNPKRGLHADNFASLICRRRVTLGEEFAFRVKCSSGSCEYGKIEKRGQIEYMKIWLSDKIKDSLTEEKIDNPNRVQLIKWDEKGDSDGKEKLGADKESERFLIYLPKRKITMVVRLLKGAVDDEVLRKINTYHKNQRASRRLSLQTVGILGQEIEKGKDWRDATYKTIPYLFFEQLGFVDYQYFNEIYNEVEGGIETDIEKPCPLCDARILTLDNSDQIPFLSRDFFSKPSRKKK